MPLPLLPADWPDVSKPDVDQIAASVSQHVGYQQNIMHAAGLVVAIPASADAKRRAQKLVAACSVQPFT